MRIMIEPVKRLHDCSSARAVNSPQADVTSVLLVSRQACAALPCCRDPLRGMPGSVELIGTTIARLLDGSPGYQGKKTDPVDEPAAKDATPLSRSCARSTSQARADPDQGWRSVSQRSLIIKHYC
jgi:hypothetical protein